MKMTFSAGDTSLIEEHVAEFNERYNLDIKIEVEELEVNRVTLSSKKITASQIFDLAVFYGMKVQKMRQEGKDFY